MLNSEKLGQQRSINNFHKKNTISCVDPVTYSERFINYITMQKYRMDKNKEIHLGVKFFEQLVNSNSPSFIKSFCSHLNKDKIEEIKKYCKLFDIIGLYHKNPIIVLFYTSPHIPVHNLPKGMHNRVILCLVREQGGIGFLLFHIAFLSHGSEHFGEDDL